MRNTATLLALCLAPVWAHAQEPPTVKLPTEVRIPVGKLGELKAEPSGKNVKWIVITPGLDWRTCETGRTLTFTGLEGTYTVYAVTASFDAISEPAKCVITIGSPQPGPGPGPAPPPPTPIDPLKVKLRAAFDSAVGSAAERKEWAKDLAALYRAAAKIAPDPAIATATQLKQKLRDASAALIGADALKEVRQAVAVELAGVLPTAEADLTDAQRAAAAALFTRLAVLLDAIAGE